MNLFIYAVLLFLVLRFSVTLFNFLSNPKLNKYGKRHTDVVSIIISPLSGQDITGSLASIKAHDYQNLEVIIADTNEGEQGAAERASGKYLLFLADNMELGEGLVNSLVHRSKIFGLSMISLVPARKMNSITDWCILPLREFIVLNMFPLRLLRFTGNAALTLANTGCLFLKAEDYRLNKSRDKMETLLANGLLINTHSSERASDLKLLPVFGNNIIVTLLYLILVVAGPLVMFIYVDPSFAALPVGLIFLSRLMISFLTNQHPVINIILHPVQMVMLSWRLLMEMSGRLFSARR